ncbi:hypothetical protein QBC44DRAFT_354462 [Cladorrhinum sp. PSN332]|nr:hypothetical protein QBC44DRAFT_354462 [Cladorrhinum sp. PSN332]
MTTHARLCSRLALLLESNGINLSGLAQLASMSSLFQLLSHSANQQRAAHTILDAYPALTCIYRTTATSGSTATSFILVERRGHDPGYQLPILLSSMIPVRSSLRIATYCTLELLASSQSGQSPGVSLGDAMLDQPDPGSAAQWLPVLFRQTASGCQSMKGTSESEGLYLCGGRGGTVRGRESVGVPYPIRKDSIPGGYNSMFHITHCTQGLMETLDDVDGAVSFKIEDTLDEEVMDSLMFDETFNRSKQYFTLLQSSAASLEHGIVLNRAIYVFTVVTVIYTPIGFIAAFWALPYCQQPAGNGTGDKFLISRGFTTTFTVVPILIYIIAMLVAIVPWT